MMQMDTLLREMNKHILHFLFNQEVFLFPLIIHESNPCKNHLTEFGLQFV